MTPRQAKIAIKLGRLVLRPGQPAPPRVWHGKPLSDFQKERLLRTAPILRRYLARKPRYTVTRLAEELGVTYQRVEQILKVGLEWFEGKGWLVPGMPLTLADETTFIEKPNAARLR